MQSLYIMGNELDTYIIDENLIIGREPINLEHDIITINFIAANANQAVYGLTA